MVLISLSPIPRICYLLLLQAAMLQLVLADNLHDLQYNEQFRLLQYVKL